MFIRMMLQGANTDEEYRRKLESAVYPSKYSEQYRGNKDKDDMGVGFDGSRGSRFGRGHDDARCG